MTNRYDQHVPIRSRYLPQTFTPNFALLDKALSSNQQLLDQGRALGDIPINALAGSDEAYAQTLRDELYKGVDGTVDAYKTSITDGARAIRDLKRDTRRRIMPGGDIHELNSRKEAFGSFQKEQSKRLADGDIDKFQYWASVTKAKKAYDDEGGYGKNSNLNLSQRQNAVDFDEFANDFLKNFHADTYGKGAMSVQGGKIIWDYDKVTQLDAQKIQRDLSQAFFNSASQTGQLNDMYDYMNSTGSLENKDNRGLAKDVLDKIDGLNITDNSSKKDIIKMQKELNKLGHNLEPDGKIGKLTKAALDSAQKLEAMTDKEFDSNNKSKFLNSYIQQLSAPYSDAKSYRESIENIKSLGDTFQSKWALKKKELDYDFTLGNETHRTQVYTKGSGMADLKGIDIDKDGNISKYKTNPDFDHNEASRSGGQYHVPYKIKVSDKSTKFLAHIQSEEGAKANPALNKIYLQNKTIADGLGDVKAYKYLTRLYNEKKNALSHTDGTYTTYGPKMQRARNVNVIGTSKKDGTVQVGNIANKTIYVTDQGVEPQVYTYAQFKAKYDVTDEQLVNNSNLLGSTHQTSDYVVSGENGIFADPNTEEVVTFTASDISIEDLKFKKGVSVLADAMHNGTATESPYVATGIPEIDGNFGRLQNRVEDVYTDDLLLEQYQNGSIDFDTWQTEQNKINKNPNLNRFEHRQSLGLYDEKGRNITNLTKGKVTVEYLNKLQNEILRNGRE